MYIFKSSVIGTAPNVFMASFVKENLNIQIQFLDWFKFGLPFFILSIFIVTYMFIKTFPIQESQENLEKTYFLEQIRQLRHPSKEEIFVFLVFLVMVAGM